MLEEKKQIHNNNIEVNSFYSITIKLSIIIKFLNI